MKIIVTGCNGRLGVAVCETLLAAGHIIVGIDAAAAPDRPHRVVVDTLLNPFAFHRALDMLGGQADAAVHLANHINSLVAPPEIVLRENGAMNSSVFLGAWQAGVPRIVFTSSVQAMLGGAESSGVMNTRLPPRLPITESLAPAPTNVYGLSKILAERALDHLTSQAQFGRPFSAVSLRLPYILNPKAFDDNASRVGRTDFLWGGSEGFAYIAREDAAEAIRLACEAPLQGHHVLWIAAPDPRPSESVEELIERFYQSVPGVEDARRRNSFVDCSRAESLLGWRPGRILRDERARRATQTRA